MVKDVDFCALLGFGSPALESGKCHRAKEATVAAIGPFSNDHYSPLPILVAPTCKTDTPENFAKMASLVVEEWDKEGELYGNIWSIDSDGDATRRLGFHGITMTQDLPLTDPLHTKLAPLKLFNIRTGR